MSHTHVWIPRAHERHVHTRLQSTPCAAAWCPEPECTPRWREARPAAGWPVLPPQGLPRRGPCAGGCRLGRFLHAKTTAMPITNTGSPFPESLLEQAMLFDCTVVTAELPSKSESILSNLPLFYQLSLWNILHLCCDSNTFHSTFPRRGLHLEKPLPLLNQKHLLPPASPT